jgi:hypothetical protein
MAERRDASGCACLKASEGGERGKLLGMRDATATVTKSTTRLHMIRLPCSVRKGPVMSKSISLVFQNVKNKNSVS